MKFCIKTPYPQKNSLNKSFERFKRDIRLRYFFAGGEEEENPTNPFNPSLYIKSDWEPPVACSEIEARINTFQKVLTSTRNAILQNTHPSTNLTPSQLYLLDWLKDHPKYIILDTDKNLGPAIMEREKYIEAMLEQHLLKGDNYKQLTKDETHNSREEFDFELTENFQFEHVNDLTDHERTFLNEATIE